MSQRLLGLDFFLILFVMLTVGGMARYPGVLIGTFVFAIGSEYLRIAAEWRMVIMGSIIVAAILVMPGGLVQLPETVRSLRQRVRRGTGRANDEPLEPGSVEPDTATPTLMWTSTPADSSAST